MANTAYSGLTGSGKSYGVVENVIIASLREGRPVVTNIPMIMEAVYVDYPDAQIYQFTTEEWLNNPEMFDNDEDYPWGAVYVVDEASDLFPAGQSVDKMHKSMRAFVKMHRHRVGINGLSNENVFIDQSMAQCSVFLRKQIHYTYCCKKHSAISEKRFLVGFYEGCYDGSAPNGKQATSFQGRYKPEVYKYYKSHTQNSSSFNSGLERVSDRRFSIFKNAWWMLYLPACVLVGLWGISTLADFFDGGFEEESPEPIEMSVTHDFSSPSYEDTSYSPPLHPSLKLAGRVGSSYSVVDATGNYRVIPASLCSPDCIIGGYRVTDYSGGF